MEISNTLFRGDTVEITAYNKEDLSVINESIIYIDLYDIIELNAVKIKSDRFEPYLNYLVITTKNCHIKLLNRPNDPDTLLNTYLNIKNSLVNLHDKDF